jgi:ribonuclease HII
MAEKRKYATYEIEEELLQDGCGDYIVGVDEVGRGPGAGSVTAGAVWIPRRHLGELLVNVKDSKALSEKRREEMYKLIDATCIWSVESVDNNIIDEVNILNATKLAMRKAIYYLDVPKIDHILVDGMITLDGIFTDTPQTQIIHGDQKSISIAAASIMAKVTRDEEMRTMHWIYPEYGWLRNKGYLTKEHIEAIQTYGITDYHRKSFRKVGDYES